MAGVPTNVMEVSALSDWSALSGELLAELSMPDDANDGGVNRVVLNQSTSLTIENKLKT